MNAGQLTRRQAAARVTARLGRSPQDVLEAAVVLEAWGGVRPHVALTLASAPREARPESRRWIALPSTPPAPPRLGVLGLVCPIVALMAWSVPLAAAMGAQDVGRAWRLALPLTLAAFFAARRRYPAGREALGVLRRELMTPALAISAGAALVGSALLAMLDPRAALPLALAVIWLCGAVLVDRGWLVVQAAALTLSAVGLAVRLPPLPVVGATVVVLLGAAVIAIRTTPKSAQRSLAWRPVAKAAAIGGLGGLLLISAPTLTGPAPGAALLAVLPPLAAGIWAGKHASELWLRLPAALEKVDVRRRVVWPLRRVVAGVLLGAVARLIGGATLLSAALFLSLVAVDAPTAHLPYSMVQLGAFALVMFLSGLLDAFHRPVAAMLVLACSLVAVHALTIGGPGWLTAAVDGTLPVLCAAVIALVLALGKLSLVFREPDQAFAALL